MRIAIPESEEDRIRLIGELLSKGILRSPALARGERSSDHDVPSVAGPDTRIIDYLRRHGAASPAELRAVLGLSRSGVHRVLRRLSMTGQVVTNGGRTSAVVYRLTDPSRN